MNKKKFRFRLSLILFLAGIVLSLRIVQAESFLRCFKTITDIYDTLPSHRQSGLDYVSLSHLCSSLQIEWKWDMLRERFMASDSTTTIALVQNNSFYQFNDSIVQLPYPPLRSGGNVYLAAADAAEIFGGLTDQDITWSTGKKMFTVNGGPDDTKELKDPGKSIEIITTEKSKTIEKSPSPPESEKAEPAVQKKSVDTDIPAGTDVKESKQQIRTVVIDPGHGGKDPGAIGQSGLQEKNVVLQVGLAMRDALKKNSTLKVFMTRSTDIFIPLRERTKFANDKGADLFISIHANSIGGNRKRKTSVKGYKVYFLSQAKNEADKLTAMMENSVIEMEEDVKKGDYLQNILIDMANNEFLTESQDLSILISETFGQSFAKIRAQHKGVGQANFWVLNGAYMPSVLVETCFISNPNEEKLLSSKKFRKKLGAAIGDAIIEFKEKYEAGL